MKHLKNNKIIDTVIKTANQTGINVFLVGGAVRDYIQNDFNHNDLDFVVTDKIDIFVKAFSKKIKGKIIVWGENDRRVVFLLNGKNISVDFALLKHETIYEDLKSRDITVNAIAVDIKYIGENFMDCLIDPLDGVDDIKNKIIRMCSDSAFINDPVRILRVLRFAGKYGYKIDALTFSLMKDSVLSINTVAVERVKKEFFSVLNYKNQIFSIKKMNEIGLLKILLPEIVEFKNIKKGPQHQYDLFDHSLQTVQLLKKAEEELFKQFDGNDNLFNPNLDELIEEGVTRRSLLVFSALLHDSGKTQTAESRGERITFTGHEKKGMDINRNLSKRIGLGKKAQKIVSDITLNHMRLRSLSLLSDLTIRALKRFIFDTKDILNEILILSVADVMATKSSAALNKIFIVIGSLLNLYESIDNVEDIDPLLNGNDIMNLTGFVNCPQIGIILNELIFLECSAQIKTRPEAIEWLKKRVNIN